MLSREEEGKGEELPVFEETVKEFAVGILVLWRCCFSLNAGCRGRKREIKKEPPVL